MEVETPFNEVLDSAGPSSSIPMMRDNNFVSGNMIMNNNNNMGNNMNGVNSNGQGNNSMGMGGSNIIDLEHKVQSVH